MKIGIVANVGTIGHIDHGRTTLAASLAALGHEVMFLSEEDVQQSKEMERLALDLVCEEGSPYSAPLHGRYRDPKRKADRKARMREAQRRAFEGKP